MTGNDIAFALGLNLHQPAGNLDDLLAADRWAAAEILYAIDRIPRSLWRYAGTGRVHLSLSGTLLDQQGVRPVFIHEHLAAHPPAGEVRIRPGAWNTGWHDGTGFTQWTGSVAQRDALARVAQVSRRLHEAGEPAAAARHLLRAQTSCNFYWGEAWMPRCHADLDRAEALLTDFP